MCLRSRPLSRRELCRASCPYMPSQHFIPIHSDQLSQLPLADPATDGGRVYAQDNRGMAIAVDVRTGGCMSGHMAGAPHRTSRRTYASYFSNRMCGAAARRRCGVEVCCVRPGRLLARVPAGVGRRGVLDLCNLGEQRWFVCDGTVSRQVGKVP